jgi:cytochrome P450
MQIPYLDAVVEETLRLSHPIPIISRESTTETFLRGVRIPKGTEILINLQGASITSPRVISAKLTEDSEINSHLHSLWDSDNVTAFIPERWLKFNQVSGEMVFDIQAGPCLNFGTGLRSCFGKKLAYSQLKVLLVLLIWRFKFERLPESLNGWGKIDGVTVDPSQCFMQLVEIEEYGH